MAKRKVKPTGSVGVSRGNPKHTKEWPVAKGSLGHHVPDVGPLRLVYMKAEDLREHEFNWRTHSDAQAGAVNALLSQVGWAGAALLNERRVEDGWPAEDAKPTMIDGHLRRKLALKRGDRVPVLVGRWTPEQERMILATLDPTASMAEADGEALKALLAQVASEDEHVKALLAQLKEDAMTALAAEPTEEPVDAGALVDKAGELQAKWGVQRGDLWQCGAHRVACGDATSKADVERVMGGEKAVTVFADPPYGMRLDTRYDAMHNGKGHRKTGDRFAPVVGDSEDFDPTETMAAFDQVAEQFWWGADYYRRHLPLGGSWIVWDKRNNESGMNLDAVHGSSFELCWSRQSHRREIARILWSGHHGMQGVDAGVRLHPTQKPVGLATWFFERYTKPGDIIADPFLGSGTTLVACEQLGRKGRGIEIEPKYVAVSLERLSNLGLKCERVECS